MAKPLIYDAMLRVRMTKKQFQFLKSYAEGHGTDMSQLVRDFIEKLERDGKRREKAKK